MESYHVRLFSADRNRSYSIGNASFRKNGEKIWSRVAAFELCPNDCYIVFYILKNSHQQHSVAEIGSVTVDCQGKIVFEREFDSRIPNGHCYGEKDVIGVVLGERCDGSLTAPVVGLLEEGIDWKSMVEKYMMSLECNYCINCGDYCPNEFYDNIIDSLPPSTVFEVRDKIEKAVEIRDLHKLGFDELISGIEYCKSALLARMRTGNFVLYMLGLPGTYAEDRWGEYINHNFKKFFPNCAGKTLHETTCGYWCKYI